jgi:hypothetical protein
MNGAILNPCSAPEQLAELAETLVMACPQKKPNSPTKQQQANHLFQNSLS